MVNTFRKLLISNKGRRDLPGAKREASRYGWTRSYFFTPGMISFLLVPTYILHHPDNQVVVAQIEPFLFPWHTSLDMEMVDREILLSSRHFDDVAVQDVSPEK